MRVHVYLSDRKARIKKKAAYKPAEYGQVWRGLDSQRGQEFSQAKSIRGTHFGDQAQGPEMKEGVIRRGHRGGHHACRMHDFLPFQESANVAHILVRVKVSLR
ncbi:hypothetical protein PoB_005487500 [Plakobranchus ocellatus]|uniref:Uncharacterized protein n=1 Tax=Plakobranchus ocellatus TaxID=259542 RepID=A0AAV4C9L4_9GAST|nr:hypothetical protein PoB_005487500 [Plakobranchus ocellatus]